MKKTKFCLLQVNLVMKVPYLLWLKYQQSYKINLRVNPWFGLVQTPISPSDLQSYVSTSTLDFRKFKNISNLTGCKIIAIFMSLHISGTKRLLKTLGRLNEEILQENLAIYHALPAPKHPVRFGKYCAANHL